MEATGFARVDSFCTYRRRFILSQPKCCQEYFASPTRWSPDWLQIWLHFLMRNVILVEGVSPEPLEGSKSGLASWTEIRSDRHTTRSLWKHQCQPAFCATDLFTIRMWGWEPRWRWCHSEVPPSELEQLEFLLTQPGGLKRILKWEEKAAYGRSTMRCFLGCRARPKPTEIKHRLFLQWQV